MLVLWKINPLISTWISSNANVLFSKSVLGPNSVILELGCGISGLPGMALAPRVSRFIATDQGYVLKLLRRNLEENSIQLSTSPRPKASMSDELSQIKTKPRTQIEFLDLDWEISDLTSLSASLQDSSSYTLDAILACDCIYNDTLIKPFVRACAELCSRKSDHIPSKRMSYGTVCIIAQQLRSSDVFEGWLAEFRRLFQVWRFPDDLLDEGLKLGSGYIVHMGLLREPKP